jgi:DegV family protein with EDD domain
MHACTEHTFSKGANMSFAIITDSSSNLPESLIDKYDLQVMALEFIVDGATYRSYLKGSVTDLQQFYHMMREGKAVSTSLARIEEAEALLRTQFEAGNDALYLGFDSALSGTYEMISTHLQSIALAYPERRLICIDTKAAALGMGLLVLKAVELREEGKTLDEVAAWTDAHVCGFAHWFTVADLKYLQRGGRLSKGVAIAGTLLNLKPILHVDDEGRLVPVQNVRGRRKSQLALLEKFEQTAAEPKAAQTVAISHGDCLEDAEFIASQLTERFGVKDVLINNLDPVIGAHAGPGTLALFFFTDTAR